MLSRRLLATLAIGALVLVTAAAEPPPSPPRARTAEPVASADEPLPIEPSAIEPSAIAAPPSPRPPRASPFCPPDMRLVDGVACSEVEQRCLDWVVEPTGEKMRCLRFAKPARCAGKRTPLRFCIDTYEYPNLEGTVPVVMKSWEEASDLCAARGRRLCTGSEWTLACEGPQRLPYPYGYARDDTACNVDRPLSGPYPRFLEKQPEGMRVSLVDWRVPSGSMPRCTSPYGVHDMTGNVDEWVVNESGKPFASGLKGGYWGPVRDRCRPMTVAHDERFRFYQIGFRCCDDAAPRSAPAVRRGAL